MESITSISCAPIGREDHATSARRGEVHAGHISCGFPLTPRVQRSFPVRVCKSLASVMVHWALVVATSSACGVAALEVGSCAQCTRGAIGVPLVHTRRPNFVLA